MRCRAAPRTAPARRRCARRSSRGCARGRCSPCWVPAPAVSAISPTLRPAASSRNTWYSRCDSRSCSGARGLRRAAPTAPASCSATAGVMNRRPLGDLADGLDHLLGVGALVQVAGRAELQAAHRVLAVGVGGRASAPAAAGTRSAAACSTSRPSRCGIAMSSSTTSIGRRAARARQRMRRGRWPASPASAMSLASARICRMPWRTIWWSSQTSTRIMALQAARLAAASPAAPACPGPGALSISMRPPNCAARSRMPITP